MCKRGREKAALVESLLIALLSKETMRVVRRAMKESPCLKQEGRKAGGICQAKMAMAVEREVVDEMSCGRTSKESFQSVKIQQF